MSIQKLMMKDKKYSPEAIEVACKFLDTVITSYDIIVEIVQDEKVNLCYQINEKYASIAISITFYPDGKIEVIDYITNKMFYFQKLSEIFYASAFDLLSKYSLKQV